MLHFEYYVISENMMNSSKNKSDVPSLMDINMAQSEIEETTAAELQAFFCQVTFKDPL